MEAQLRVYTVRPGELADWVAEWRANIAPLRRRFGFGVVGPWIDEDSDTFVWLLEYAGAESFEAADRRYYESAERAALHPDPARHLAAVETRSLRAAEPAPARLFRAVVPVGDVERAAAAYAEVLAIRGERVSRGRHYFDCAGTILACLDPAADGEQRQPVPNPEYVYLAVADLEAARERALASGFADVGPIAVRPWGERSFYARDPFGNRLCLVEHGTEFTGGGFVP